jgi:hypothetical protein
MFCSITYKDGSILEETKYQNTLQEAVEKNLYKVSKQMLRIGKVNVLQSSSYCNFWLSGKTGCRRESNEHDFSVQLLIIFLKILYNNRKFLISKYCC